MIIIIRSYIMCHSCCDLLLVSRCKWWRWQSTFAVRI